MAEIAAAEIAFPVKHPEFFVVNQELDERWESVNSLQAPSAKPAGKRGLTAKARKQETIEMSEVARIAQRKAVGFPLMLSLPAFVEIGPALPRALLLLLKAPAGDGTVVPAAQHRRNLHPSKLGRPGEVGMLQQAGTVAFLLQAGLGAHRARQ